MCNDVLDVEFVAANDGMCNDVLDVEIYVSL